MRFLITERPNDLGMNSYLEDLKRFNVKCVVRVCEGTYDVEKLVREGIVVRDLCFPDGQAPGEEVNII
jgi:protein tyrosine phosphatase type 4A